MKNEKKKTHSHIMHQYIQPLLSEHKKNIINLKLKNTTTKKNHRLVGLFSKNPK